MRNMKILTKEQIFKRREKIEKELLELLKKRKSDFGLKDIKEIIYNEENQDNFVQMITMFDRGQELDEMSTILEIINDAWNYFPHRCLDGLCPMEKILELQKKEEL